MGGLLKDKTSLKVVATNARKLLCAFARPPTIPHNVAFGPAHTQLCRCGQGERAGDEAVDERDKGDGCECPRHGSGVRDGGVVPQLYNPPPPLLI